MKFIASFNKQFAIEFENYPLDQQNLISDFIQLFTQVGLGDFSKYPGKISNSWAGLNASDPNFTYTRSNSLWHYHIGLPNYISTHSKYKTSDWVLHFQWPNKGSTIAIVDICYHYKSTGEFHIPAENYLTK